MKAYVNVGVLPETREKLRLLARKTNAKKSQIIDDALTEYSEKILFQSTIPDRQIVKKNKIASNEKGA